MTLACFLTARSTTFDRRNGAQGRVPHQIPHIYTLTDISVCLAGINPRQADQVRLFVEQISSFFALCNSIQQCAYLLARFLLGVVWVREYNVLVSDLSVLTIIR